MHCGGPVLVMPVDVEWMCLHIHSTCVSLHPGHSYLSAAGAVPECRVCLQHQEWKPVRKEK